MRSIDMPKGSAASADIMALILNGSVPGWATTGERFAALHTANPANGSQSTLEVGYFGYARVPCGAWVPCDDTYINADILEFPICAGAQDAAITYVSIGTSRHGDGNILYAARLHRPLNLKINQRILFEIGTLVIAES